MIPIIESNYECDVLVVGGGISGLMAAIAAADKGARVIIAEKADVARSGDGVAGNDHFLCYVPELHGSPEAFDREWAISGMGTFIDRENWPVFRDRTFECALDWERWGIDMRPSGEYQCIGHAYPNRMRIWLKYDGRNQKKVLRMQALQRGVKIVNKIAIEDYLKDERGEICGAVGIDSSHKEPSIVVFSCKSIITCTGLANRLYPSITAGMFFNTAHCPANAGAGRAAAFRAGAELVNMEIPITWVGPKYLERCGKASWIGLLADPYGTPAGPFIEKPNKLLGDITADIWRSVFNDKLMNGTGPLFMNCTEIDQQDMDYMTWAFKCEGITSINELMEKQGFDLREKMVEFTPYEPQCAGGIRTDCNSASSLPGLYAAGDESGNGAQGISGAAVTGRIAGEQAAEFSLGKDQVAFSEVCENPVVAAFQARCSRFLERGEGSNWRELLGGVQQIMNDYAGIKVPRYEELLSCGRDYLRDLEAMAESDIACADSHELVRTLEAFDLLQIGQIVCTAAIEHRESRYMHRRIDCNYANPLLMSQYLVVRNDSGAPVCRWENKR